MDITDLTNKINKSTDEVDLITARKLLENNLELVGKHRQLLNRNARSLFEIIRDHGVKQTTLNRSEMNTIYAINSYATNFDLNGLKLSIKNNLELLMREDIRHYLNQDAKALLSGMKVLQQ